MESKPKGSLTRIAWQNGHMTVDPTGKAPGRGAYLCTDPACLDRAFQKKGFQRAFRSPVPKEDLDQAREVLEALKKGGLPVEDQ